MRDTMNEATNDKAPAEPQVIQFNPESNEYSTFFDKSQVDMTGFKLFNINPGQVKNNYPTFITPKTARDPVTYNIPNKTSAGPKFGVPVPAQSQQPLVNGISTQSIPTTIKHNTLQSLAEANPTLVQFLNQSISTPGTSFNKSQSVNVAKPIFNLRPGTSKAEIASSAPALKHQGRAFTPHPTAGVQSTAHNQQPPSRAFTPIPLTNSHPRATTSTPIPTSFIPPSSAQMSQFSQSMAFMQRPARGNPLRPGSATHFPQSSALPGTPLPNTPSFPQSRLYHPYPHQVRQPMRTPYFNGAALGKKYDVTGDVGALKDPTKQEWVRELREEQEKYLEFHLRLFSARQARAK